jgi:TATA-binding protein-associated factor
LNQVLKKLSFEIFSKILTLSYVYDNNSIPGLDDYLNKKHTKGRDFLFEFKNSSHFDIEIPSPEGVTLRNYQIEGVKWVSFLFKYNLNGALCDDMGLGKTIQSLIG